MAVFGVALAVGGCADLLGYGDYDFGAGSGGGTTTTTSGTAGSGGGDGTCLTEADCAGSPHGERCDLDAGRCVECLPLPEANTCAFGLYCDPATKSCAIGCAADADCQSEGSALVCDAGTGRCIQCESGAPCPPGTECDSTTGICQPGCGATADCPDQDWACCGAQCRNVAKDVAHCGGCEEPCLPDQSTTWLCLAGACIFQSCTSGFADCDQNLAEGNGCEVDTQSDPAHCGGCAEACDLSSTVEGCVDGACTVLSCQPGFEDCDRMAESGCETDLQTDTENCGACDEPCEAFPNGGVACEGGECVLDGCDRGFGDCDDNPENGCEADTTSSDLHCGTCGAPCLLPDATSQCTAGECVLIQCSFGFDDCNGFDFDGCEVDLLTDAQNCGMCTVTCDLPHTTAVCSSGGCAPGPCEAGFEDCNGIAGDGCEAELASDEEHCGACGSACASLNGAAQCLQGACQLTCNQGYDDCDGLPANGCEANLKNGALTCGDCDTACPTDTGVPFCSMGQCGVGPCASGLANCDSLPANGCETDITTVSDCGACAAACSANHGTPSCGAMGCTITCDPGHDDCNDTVIDGCEQPLNTSQHCTGCFVPCARPHALTSCALGSCQIVTCESGWIDCNGVQADGCECNGNCVGTLCQGSPW